MKLDCILTACNENPLYIDFIPLFVKSWNILYPNIDVKILLISNNIPDEFIEYKDNIILFEPLNNISTAFTSQYIRNLYPSLLNYENGIMITDIDMIPMNDKYYTENIKTYDNNKFIYLRNVCLYHNEIAMCYNVATNKIWSEIFNIKTKEDLINRLYEAYNKINYIDGHGNSGWSTDQIDLFNYVMEWNKKTGNFIYLKDNETGFNRLDRIHRFILTKKIIKNIKNGLYSDYHLYRPYKLHKEINDKIIELLQK